MSNQHTDKKGMSVLILTNMYPSEQKRFSGIFVKNQYDELQKQKTKEEIIDIFFMKRSFTSPIGSVIKYILTALRFIPRLFKKYDVIHLHYFYPLIYLVIFYKCFYNKTKTIVTYHGSDLTKKITKRNKNKLKKLANKIDVHIPVGDALETILKDKLDINANLILPVGVNNAVFYYEKEIKEYDYIYVGSFIYRKGVDLIINVLKKINPSIRICLIGQGDYIEEIKELSTTKSNIDLYEGLSQKEIQKKLVRSKFLLLPTRNEGFPTSTIEAMYCGVPVLVSNIPQTIEQVDEGKNGFIIPVNNEEALLNKMIELTKIDNKTYEVMVKTTLTYFKDISLSSVCDELYSIYTNLAKDDA